MNVPDISLNILAVRLIDDYLKIRKKVIGWMRNNTKS